MNDLRLLVQYPSLCKIFLHHSALSHCCPLDVRPWVWMTLRCGMQHTCVGWKPIFQLLAGELCIARISSFCNFGFGVSLPLLVVFVILVLSRGSFAFRRHILYLYYLGLSFLRRKQHFSSLFYDSQKLFELQEFPPFCFGCKLMKVKETEPQVWAEP